jgi:hypothetical protein
MVLSEQKMVDTRGFAGVFDLSFGLPPLSLFTELPCG